MVFVCVLRRLESWCEVCNIVRWIICCLRTGRAGRRGCFDEFCEFYFAPCQKSLGLCAMWSITWGKAYDVSSMRFDEYHRRRSALRAVVMVGGARPIMSPIKPPFCVYSSACQTITLLHILALSPYYLHILLLRNRWEFKVQKNDNHVSLQLTTAQTSNPHRCLSSIRSKMAIVIYRPYCSWIAALGPIFTNDVALLLLWTILLRPHLPLHSYTPPHPLRSTNYIAKTSRKPHHKSQENKNKRLFTQYQ